MYNVGIIGYGGFGMFLHRAWNGLDGVQVLAAADQDPKRDPGGIRFYSTWQELVSDAEIEIVSIVTPPNTHAEIACYAMQHGKHVLVEKPLATTLEDAKQIIAVRDQTGCKAVVDYMQRFNPLVVGIEKLATEGMFGSLRRMVVENYATDDSLSPKHWFWDRSISGGIFVEHAVHFFDMTECFTESNPIAVRGSAHRTSDGRENQVLATIVYNNGMMASHYHDFSRPGFFESTSIRLVFALAEIEMEGWIPVSGRLRCLCDPGRAAALLQLPDWDEVSRLAVNDIEDISRPEGWGEVGQSENESQVAIKDGEREIGVETMIVGNFSTASTKADTYLASLRDLQRDFLMTIENPDYTPKVRLEDGLHSLEIALRADQWAHQSNH
ncbi:Gfo/Idh/MocA family protein [Candidatus Neomarinimicrobiota bacterium]